jgi:hypothetical protein
VPTTRLLGKRSDMEINNCQFDANDVAIARNSDMHNRPLCSRKEINALACYKSKWSSPSPPSLTNARIELDSMEPSFFTTCGGFVDRMFRVCGKSQVFTDCPSVRPGLSIRSNAGMGDSLGSIGPCSPSGRLNLGRLMAQFAPHSGLFSRHRP